jgi:hypothetical protein
LICGRDYDDPLEVLVNVYHVDLGSAKKFHGYQE